MTGRFQILVLGLWKKAYYQLLTNMFASFTFTKKNSALAKYHQVNNEIEIIMKMGSSLKQATNTYHQIDLTKQITNLLLPGIEISALAARIKFPM